MELIETAKLTSKGQLTVPASIRGLLKLKEGSTVLFKVTKNGVFFAPCEIKEKESFSRDEWRKLERLASERGRIFRTAAGARKHLESL
jgi:AbrB family looped-hinge helix DNA binding protein